MNHKIKIGIVETEYEGTEDYLKIEVPSLIDKLVSLKDFVPIEDSAESQSISSNDEKPGF